MIISMFLRQFHLKKIKEKYSAKIVSVFSLAFKKISYLIYVMKPSFCFLEFCLCLSSRYSILSKICSHTNHRLLKKYKYKIINDMEKKLITRLIQFSI